MTNSQNLDGSTPTTGTPTEFRELQVNGTSYAIPEDSMGATPEQIASVFAELGISVENQQPVFSAENPHVLKYEAPRGQNG